MTSVRLLVGSTHSLFGDLKRLFHYGNAFAAFAKSCELPWLERRPKQRQLGQEARRLRRLFEAQLLETRRSASAYPVGSTVDASTFDSIQTALGHVATWSERLDSFVARWRVEPVAVAKMPPDFVAALTVRPANTTTSTVAPKLPVALWLTLAVKPANRVVCRRKEGLPMGRPLSPKLVLRGDHYAFRCVVKDGGRPWVPLPPGLTVAAAQAMALEIATLAAKGTPDGGVPVFSGKKKTITAVETFADWADRWIESREARGLTSARDDRSRLKGHVLPLIGPKPVAKITRDDVETVVASLDAKVRAGKLGWKTAINVWGALSKALDDAANAKDRTLRARGDNPAAGVRGPDLGTKKVKTFLYPSEVSALLSSELVPLDFRRAVALAVYLGMRLGELHALKWSDVDLTEGTVLVHQAWDRKGKKTKAPKSNATRRFTFEAEALPLLKALHRETEGKGAVLAVPNYPNAATDLRDYLRKVGVTRSDLFVTDATRKQLSFHDLRATCLTWMALRGDNVLKIKARAGHADLQTTEGYVRTAGELTNVSPASVFAPLPRALLAVTTDQNAGQNEEETTMKHAEKLAERNGNRTRQGRLRAPRRF